MKRQEDKERRNLRSTAVKRRKQEVENKTNKKEEGKKEGNKYTMKIYK
jgi:hypothetical protein